MIALLAPDVVERFPVDPLGTMEQGLGLRVQAADHLMEQRADGGACDGLSFLKDGVVLYAPTLNSKRENFTLAHEVGHWLVAQIPEIFDWLFEQHDANRLLETLCDRIAQHLLLGESTLAAAVGQGPLRAQSVVDLYQSSQASMPACAIALAARIPRLGAVLLADREYNTDELVVSYASVHPHPTQGWPKVYPWPGQAVPSGHPIRTLKEGASVQRRTFWAMPWGDRADFYMDALAITGRRVVAVLAETDLWGAEVFHPPTTRQYDDRPEQSINCCGQVRAVRGYPCQICGQVFCPNCKKCRCDRQNDELVRCAGTCFLSYRPNLLENGLCEECR